MGILSEGDGTCAYVAFWAPRQRVCGLRIYQVKLQRGGPQHYGSKTILVHSRADHADGSNVSLFAS